MTHDTDDTDEDESLEELKERRTELERLDWDTSTLDEQIEEKEREEALAARRVEVEKRYQEAQELGLPLAAEALAARRDELDGALDDSGERKEALEQEIERRERVIEQAKEHDGYGSVVEQNRDEVEALQANLADLEEGEIDVLSSPTAGSADPPMTAGPSAGGTEAHPVDTEPDRTVDVEAALEKWGVEKTADAVEAAIDARGRRVEVFEKAGWESMAAQTRSRIEVLQAAADGRSEAEVEDAGVAMNVRTRSSGGASD